MVCYTEYILSIIGWYLGIIGKILGNPWKHNRKIFEHNWRRPIDRATIVHFNCVGSDRPTIRDLNNFVVPSVGSRWYNLGIQLLEPQFIEILWGLKNENKNTDVGWVAKYYRYKKCHLGTVAWLNPDLPGHQYWIK